MPDRSRRMGGIALVAAASVLLSLAGPSAASAADPVTSTVSGELLRVSNDAVPTFPGETVGDGYLIETVDGTLVPVDLPAAYEDFEAGTSIVARLSEPDADGVRDVVSATLTEPAVAATTTAPTTAHHAYVVVVDDPTVTSDITPAQADAMTASAESYWLREARGAISTFDTPGWATLATTTSSCAMDSSTLWTKGKALFPGVSFGSSGNHLIIFSPSTCGYSYAGIAQVGASLANGGLVQIVGTQWSIVAHEIGHNLSLGHANLEYVGTSSAVTIGQYYGAFGPMSATVGGYPPTTLEAAFQDLLTLPGRDSHVATLGWPGQATTTTVVLSPASGSAGITAATFTDPADGARYFVEYRSGADTGAFYTAPGARLTVNGRTISYTPGVHVTRVDGRTLTTLSTYDGAGLAWATHQPGEAYIAASGRFAVAVRSTSTSDATVAITLAGDGGLPGPRPRGSLPATRTTVTAPAWVDVTTPFTVSVRSTATDGPLSGPVTLQVDALAAVVGTMTDGLATFAFPAGSVARGTHTMTGTYLASSSHGQSAGTATMAVAGTVETSTTSVTLSAPTIAAGSSATATVRVASLRPAAGSYELRVDGAAVATGTLTDGAGTVSLPTSLKVGSHTVVAAYLGAPDVLPSTSTSVPLTVAKGATVTRITATGFTPGARPKVTVTVAPVSGQPPATGTVDLYKGSVKLASLVLDQGTATWSGSTWVSSTYSLTATYLGSVDHAASSATAVLRTSKVATAAAGRVVGTGATRTSGGGTAATGPVAPVVAGRPPATGTVSLSASPSSALLAATGTVGLFDGSATVDGPGLLGARATWTGPVWDADTHPLSAGLLTVHHSGDANVKPRTCSATSTVVWW
ncbi:Ig-like domain repeat protein [Cellulomonas sp. URHB0016]